jgi:hypothetical protein
LKSELGPHFDGAFVTLSRQSRVVKGTANG